MARDLELRIDRPSFGKAMRDIRAFDKNLATATRKRLRDAAKPVVGEIRGRLGSGEIGGALAAGTKVSISTGRRAGIRIITDGSHLPDSKQPLVRAWDKPMFRHMVFGNPEKWVSQSGRPYFGTVINPRLQQMRAAVERALQDAIDQMGR